MARTRRNAYIMSGEHRYQAQTDVSRADLAKLEQLRTWPVSDADRRAASKIVASQTGIPAAERLELLRMLGLTEGGR